MTRLACILLLGVTAAVPPAGDEDPCILQLEAIRSRLDHTAEGVTTVTEPARVGRGLTEALVLGDGTVVEFRTGGCVHYGFGFTFRSVVLGDRSFASASARTAELLRRVPVREDGVADVALLLDALASPLATPAAAGETWLDCGDAVCRLLVVPDEKTDTVTLTVSYDFPL